MSAATPRRIIVQILLESSFYCGTLYGMPLRERLELVKRLTEQMGQKQQVHDHRESPRRNDGN